MTTATTTPHPLCACRHCPSCNRRRDRKLYRIERDRGLRRTCSAEPIREHLLWLAEQQIGRRTVADGTGVSELSLYRITHGESQRVLNTTARRILAFRPESADAIPNARKVDATPTRLRYEAIIALGYTQEFVARGLGRSHGDIEFGERVTRRRALEMLALAREVGYTPGPSRKAAVQARNRGWRTPADYDEELFYDPSWDGAEPRRRHKRADS